MTSALHWYLTFKAVAEAVVAARFLFAAFPTGSTAFDATGPRLRPSVRLLACHCQRAAVTTDAIACHNESAGPVPVQLFQFRAGSGWARKGGESLSISLGKESKLRVRGKSRRDSSFFSP